MPVYDYQCSSCEHAFEKTLKISEMRQPLSEPCPSCGTSDTITKHLLSAPSMGDPVRLGVRKPNGDFREVLSKIHENNYKSNLNLKL